MSTENHSSRYLDISIKAVSEERGKKKKKYYHKEEKGTKRKTVEIKEKLALFNNSVLQ